MNYAIQFSKKYAVEFGYHRENIHIFLPEYKKYFDEIIHSKNFEKSRGYVPMLEIFNLIMNMTNRLGVKVH